MNFFKKIERILPWSFLGFFLGAPALYLTIHEKSPDIIFQKIAESNILDVHREMKELTIYFRGDDIREAKKNLKFYIITVRNDGDKNIVQSDYDQNQVWGLEFSNSKIIEPPAVIDSNSEYLKNNLSPNIIGQNTVELSKVIFEKGKYATLEIKVLHDINEIPIITVKGKIAGIEKQKIDTLITADNETSFWEKLFTGSLIVQLVRAVMYFVGFIFLFAILIYISELPRMIRKKVSKVKLKEYLSPILSQINDDDKDKVLSFCGIMNGDISEMESVIDILDDQSKLSKLEAVLAEESTNKREDIDDFMPFRVYNVNVRNKIVSVNDNGKVDVSSEGVELLKKTIEHFKKNPKPDNLIWFRR